MDVDGGGLVDGWRDEVCAWTWDCDCDCDCDGSCACSCAKRVSIFGSERSKADGGRSTGGYSWGCDEGGPSTLRACSEGDWEGGETEPDEEASLAAGDGPTVRSGTPTDGAGDWTTCICISTSTGALGGWLVTVAECCRCAAPCRMLRRWEW